MGGCECGCCWCLFLNFSWVPGRSANFVDGAQAIRTNHVIIGLDAIPFTRRPTRLCSSLTHSPMAPRRKARNSSGPSSSFSAFLSSSRVAPDGNIYAEATASAVRPRWATHSATALSFSDVVARTEDRDPTGRPLGVGSLAWYARKLINERLRDVSPEVLRRVPWDPFGKVLWLDAVST